MRRSFTHQTRLGLIFLGLLFLLVLAGHGVTNPLAQAGSIPPTGTMGLARQEFQSPFLPMILASTSLDSIPEGSDDLFCHHAYSGPLPTWECHHPETHLSFPSLSPPGALEESTTFPMGPDRHHPFFPPIHFATSRSLISPDHPPRHTLPL